VTFTESADLSDLSDLFQWCLVLLEGCISEAPDLLFTRDQDEAARRHRTFDQD
jgi:hypothetical protein